MSEPFNPGSEDPGLRPAEPAGLRAAVATVADVVSAPKRPSLFWWLTAVIIAADQISKAMVHNRPTRPSILAASP